MKTLLPVALSAFLALPALARNETEARDQGAVRAHVWTSVAGLENARTAVRALTALANDATAWDQRHASDLLKEARDGLDFARVHAHHLRNVTTNNKDAPKDLARLDSDLDGAKNLLGRLQAPISRGVGPDQDDTRADNTMLGGAASDRGLPPGRGDDVTQSANRGQRGGTRAVRSMRNELKAAWDKLDAARSDLDRVAGDFDATTKLPNP